MQAVAPSVELQGGYLAAAFICLGALAIRVNEYIKVRTCLPNLSIT